MQILLHCCIFVCMYKIITVSSVICQRLEGERKLSECEEVYNRKRRELLHLQNENKEQEFETKDFSRRIHQRSAVFSDAFIYFSPKQ